MSENNSKTCRSLFRKKVSRTTINGSCREGDCCTFTVNNIGTFVNGYTSPDGSTLMPILETYAELTASIAGWRIPADSRMQPLLDSDVPQAFRVGCFISDNKSTGCWIMKVSETRRLPVALWLAPRSTGRKEQLGNSYCNGWEGLLLKSHGLGRPCHTSTKAVIVWLCKNGYLRLLHVAWPMVG